MRASTGRLAAVVFASCFLPGWIALAAPGATTKPVDPKRYAGRWYEVARLPNKVQSKCASATSDWLRQPDGGFQVVQTCKLAQSDGAEKVWRGAGRIVDPASNSRFRISFFGGLVQKDYSIVDRGDDYSWCLLTADPKFLWIMSRRPVVTAEQKAALVEKARALGYDVSKLIFDNQPAA